MKKIIIFLLIVILGLIAWGQYKKYKRFSLKEYQYEVPSEISSTDENSDLLLDYFEAVEALNGHVITQWSANDIDVRNPDDDDGTTMAAVTEYNRRMASVKFYENQLLNPKKTSEPKQKSEEDLRKDMIRAQFYANPAANSLRIGDQNAMVYEIQRLLISNGDSIKHDGLFRAETFNALKKFEEQNGLFPDGKLDALTLEALLR